VRALVTGHRGFVGRHMMHRLVTKGYQVEGVDIKQGADCRDFFRKSDKHFDLVVHCAAVVGGRQMIDGQPLGVAINLSIDAEMFNWALRTRPSKVVYFSSSAAYPVILQDGEDHVLLGEWHLDVMGDVIQVPDQSYGWAKVTGEMLAHHARAQGIETYIFRPFSGYGADQDLTYPFPSFVARAKKRANPFDIWGGGDQARDFVHVSDVVGAVFACLDAGEQGPINIGTGLATNFDQLARLCMQAVGYRGLIRHLEDKPTGVNYRVANIDRLRRVYTPKISIDQGVRDAVKS
jgi:nucleoside-diphosphate-sugar epimerase